MNFLQRGALAVVFGLTAAMPGCSAIDTQPVAQMDEAVPKSRIFIQKPHEKPYIRHVPSISDAIDSISNYTGAFRVYDIDHAQTALVLSEAIIESRSDGGGSGFQANSSYVFMESMEEIKDRPDLKARFDEFAGKSKGLYLEWVADMKPGLSELKPGVKKIEIPSEGKVCNVELKKHNNWYRYHSVSYNLDGFSSGIAVPTDLYGTLLNGSCTKKDEVSVPELALTTDHPEAALKYMSENPGAYLLVYPGVEMAGMAVVGNRITDMMTLDGSLRTAKEPFVFESRLADVSSLNPEVAKNMKLVSQNSGDKWLQIYRTDREGDTHVNALRGKVLKFRDRFSGFECAVDTGRDVLTDSTAYKGAGGSCAPGPAATP